MPRINLIVKGRVHGVGFRFFSSRTANSLGLKGIVRNLPNGCVEIIAEGPKPMLDKLLERIRDGPITARVDDVDCKWEEEKNEFSCFEIKF
ncbi:MAG: acylphosphatase [Candidatus Diapherotrites archaeon]|uniref:acylphosphatase n=1 Tax=Candidatus Iainarchaeum sp. TaxID=3101447 RepID=A0A2D6LZV0_9ARCH|nr:acylphosphatase [Candidatus Diapherotrites archaeon]|tara:strand:+ start:1368 stop:1640 length:273 start_codon:yes stop_codon:yes gene_type:complete